MKHRSSRCLARPLRGESTSGRIFLPLVLLATSGLAVYGFSSVASANASGRVGAVQDDAAQDDAAQDDAQKSDAQKSDAQKSDAQKSDAQKSDAQKSDAQKSDAAKSDAQKSAEAKLEAQKKAAQEKAAQEKAADKKPVSVGRGRLSGKGAPPKPASVPTLRGVTPVATGGATGSSGLETPTPQKPLTPEQQKAQAEYLAKQKALGNQPAGARGAVPRPPKNPNAKLEIEFGSDKHDFGKARQGESLTHVFKMKSGGSEPLIITQASPTCGCTLGEVKVRPKGADVPELYSFGDPIEPGTDIELTATLETASKRNKTNVRINIYSNDGTAGQNQLQLQANIEPFIVATPSFLQLGDIREGVEKTATVDFRTTGGERILLTPDTSRPVPTPQGLSIDVTPMNPDEEGKSNQWRATFTISGDSEEGPKGHLLRLNSDVALPVSTAEETTPVKPGTPTVYTADANISYRILGALSLQPQYVSLGLVRPGQVVVRNVRLTSHEPEFDLAGVKVELTGEAGQPLQWAEQFVASAKPVSGSNAIDIELRLTGLPEEADGSFRGRVKILTGHSAKPEMDFRFSGVCRKLAGNGVERPVPVKKNPALDPAKKGSGK